MRVLFICLLSLFFLVSNSQTILLSPMDTNVHITNADLSDFWIDIYAYSIYITNTTEDTLYMAWKKELPPNCPEEWELGISDLWNDYIPSVNSNYDPDNGLNAAFPILPMQTVNSIFPHLYPRSTAGCCDVTIHISELNDPDKILASAHIDYQINAPDCMPLAVSDESENISKIYPNPTFGILNIESALSIKHIDIFNLHGILLERIKNISGPIHMADYPAGLYFFKIFYLNGLSEWKRFELIN